MEKMYTFAVPLVVEIITDQGEAEARHMLTTSTKNWTEWAVDDGLTRVYNYEGDVPDVAIVIEVEELRDEN